MRAVAETLPPHDVDCVGADRRSGKRNRRVADRARGTTGATHPRRALLAEHAVTILVGSTAHTSTSTRTPSQPATVRVGGFATGIRLSLLPIVAELTETFPKVHFVISEYEPIEAFALLTNDDLDLALTYDYNLALASPGPVLKTVALWSVPWRFGVPADTPDGPAKVGDYADRTWIVNSRNTADEDAVRTLASLAGFVPRIAHEVDSLELVEDLIIAGYGVGLLPIGRPTTAGVKVLRWPNPRRYSPPTQSRAEGGQPGRRGGPTRPDAPSAGHRTATAKMAAPCPRNVSSHGCRRPRHLSSR